MIYVTRLDGSRLVINAELIETVEHTADTVINLIDGKRFVVATPVEEVVEAVTAYRQRVARPLSQAATSAATHEAERQRSFRDFHDPIPFHADRHVAVREDA